MGCWSLLCEKIWERFLLLYLLTMSREWTITIIPQWPAKVQHQQAKCETISGIWWKEGDHLCGNQQQFQGVLQPFPIHIPVESAYTMGIWTDLKINYEKQPPNHVTLASPSGRNKERAEDNKAMPYLKKGSLQWPYFSQSTAPIRFTKQETTKQCLKLPLISWSSSMKTKFSSWKLRPEAKWPLDGTKPWPGPGQVHFWDKQAELLASTPQFPPVRSSHALVLFITENCRFSRLSTADCRIQILIL